MTVTVLTPSLASAVASLMAPATDFLLLVWSLLPGTSHSTQDWSSSLQTPSPSTPHDPSAVTPTHWAPTSSMTVPTPLSLASLVFLGPFLHILPSNCCFSWVPISDDSTIPTRALGPILESPPLTAHLSCGLTKLRSSQVLPQEVRNQGTGNMGTRALKVLGWAVHQPHSGCILGPH